MICQRPSGPPIGGAEGALEVYDIVLETFGYSSRRRAAAVGVVCTNYLG